MTRLGIKALIIEGEPQDDDWKILYLDSHGARFDPAEDCGGLGVYESARRLIERYGDKSAMAIIGPGGEQRLASAGNQNLDKDRIPSRIAARGGLGAVMGAKRLKAIIFDARAGDKTPIVHLEAYRQAQKEYNQALINHPQTKIYADYGTAAMPRMSNGFGGLPTRNFSQGRFTHVEQISGEYMRHVHQEITGAC